MINYEPHDSPFYVANKNFCEQIEGKLNAFKYEYSGWCNSYGYEIDTNFIRNNNTCHLKYIKNQTTRNGVIIPMNAGDYFGVEFSIEGLNKEIKLNSGKNKIRRLFSNQKLKELLPAPFYISTNSPADKLSTSGLIKVIADNKIDVFHLKNGKAKIEIYFATSDMFNLIDGIEKTILNLS